MPRPYHRQGRPRMETDTCLSVLAAGEGVHAVEQRLRLSDEALGGVLVYGLAGEGGGFEQRGHLAGDAVAVGGERGQLVFERVVGGVAGGVARDSRGRDLQAGGREGAERGVDLLVRLGEAAQSAAVLAQADRQGVLVERL